MHIAETYSHCIYTVLHVTCVSVYVSLHSSSSFMRTPYGRSRDSFSALLLLLLLPLLLPLLLRMHRYGIHDVAIRQHKRISIRNLNCCDGRILTMAASAVAAADAAAARTHQRTSVKHV